MSSSPSCVSPSTSNSGEKINTVRSRKKSNSISNAMLQRGNKKVSFSTYLQNSTSQVFTTSPSSSSEDDLNETSLKQQQSLEGDSAHLKSPPLIQQEGFTPSSGYSSPSMKLSLRKLSSYPYTGEKMGVTRSLYSHMVDNNNSHGQNTNLPEFNKRPLTDTPIVSGVASPVARGQLSDSEDEVDNEVNSLLTADNKKRSDGLDMNRPISRTKNISHLNLTDLTNESKSSSISPMTTQEEMKPNNEEFKRLQMDKETRANLLQDVPIELQRQFEKTPSIEKLKNLLLTKPPPSARKAYTLNIPGQTSSKTSPDGRIASVDVGSKLVIVMVGLPARGKSYITNKLTRYLNWLQHDCRVFNVGNTRRKDKENNAGPETKPLPDTNTPNNERQTPSPQTNPAMSPPSEHNADFFSPDNKASNTLREKWAMDTLDQLLNYVIDGSGSVGIFDATNSTKRRRLKVLKRIQQRSNGELKVLFLESICSNPTIIESNIRLKLSGPDYRDMDPEVALKDFVGRLHNYEKAYETIDEVEEAIPGFQYVKMIDVGKKVVSYNIQGFLASQTIYFLLNFNLCERQIWVTRHGESVDNLSGRIGGDSHLTRRGANFSRTLAKFMEFQRKEFRKQQLERFSSRLELRYNSIFNENDVATLDNIPTEPNFCVWTSMLYRAVETGQFFNDQLFSIKEMRMLNELGGGKFEGLTYEEIQKRYPKEFQARITNKLTYRYPGVGGESYLDVLTRLRPLITEIERTTDHLLIVSHRVVLRVLLAYFLNLDRSSIGELDVPLHTLYCLESKPYGTDYRMYEYDESLDWFVQVQPEHQKNIKEVGVVFKERKYSVVPTAPPSSSSNKNRNRKNISNQSNTSDIDNNFSLRRSLSVGAKLSNNNMFISSTNEPATNNLDNTNNSKNSLTSKKLADLNRLRKP